MLQLALGSQRQWEGPLLSLCILQTLNAENEAGVFIKYMTNIMLVWTALDVNHLENDLQFNYFIWRIIFVGLSSSICCLLLWSVTAWTGDYSHYQWIYTFLINQIVKEISHFWSCNQKNVLHFCSVNYLTIYKNTTWRCILWLAYLLKC